MGLTSPFWDGNGKNPPKKFYCYLGHKGELPKRFFSRHLGPEQKLPKSFPVIWDRNRKPKKLFQLFGKGSSGCSQWEIYGNMNYRSSLLCTQRKKYINFILPLGKGEQILQGNLHLITDITALCSFTPMLEYLSDFFLSSSCSFLTIRSGDFQSKRVF